MGLLDWFGGGPEGYYHRDFIPLIEFLFNFLNLFLTLTMGVEMMLMKRIERMKLINRMETLLIVVKFRLRNLFIYYMTLIYHSKIDVFIFCKKVNFVISIFNF